MYKLLRAYGKNTLWFTRIVSLHLQQRNGQDVDMRGFQVTYKSIKAEAASRAAPRTASKSRWQISRENIAQKCRDLSGVFGHRQGRCVHFFQRMAMLWRVQNN